MTVSDPLNFDQTLLANKRRQFCPMFVVQLSDQDKTQQQNRRVACDLFDRHEVLTMSRQWIFDSLSSFTLLPIDSYLIDIRATSTSSSRNENDLPPVEKRIYATAFFSIGGSNEKGSQANKQAPEISRPQERTTRRGRISRKPRRYSE